MVSLSAAHCLTISPLSTPSPFFHNVKFVQVCPLSVCGFWEKKELLLLVSGRVTHLEECQRYQKAVYWRGERNEQHERLSSKIEVCRKQEKKLIFRSPSYFLVSFLSTTCLYVLSGKKILAVTSCLRESLVSLSQNKQLPFDIHSNFRTISERYQQKGRENGSFVSNENKKRKKGLTCDFSVKRGMKQNEKRGWKHQRKY